MENKFFTKSERMSQEYCCTVVRLGEIEPIPGANTVAKTLVNGRTIVISKDRKEGDIMIYCSNESQLNFDFLSVNNLFQHTELNCNRDEVKAWLDSTIDPVTGAIEEKIFKEYMRTHRGYFDDKGRVRMKKLAGEMSMGVLFEFETLVKWCPMLKGLNIEELVGLDFDTVNGELFIKPYVPIVKEREYEGTRKDRKRGKKLAKFDRMIPGQFAFHYDTQLFERSVNRFKPEDVVTISNKLHGTSYIIGNVLVKHPKWRGLYEKIFLKLPKFLQFTREDYDVIYSSRNVIQNSTINPNKGPGYSTGLNACFDKYYQLLKPYIPINTTFYGEIVGYVEKSNTFIQKVGKGYDYCCAPGENRLMIYRIVETEPDGTKKEYNVRDVHQYTIEFKRWLNSQSNEDAAELADRLLPIDILYHGELKDLYPELDVSNHWHANLLERMKNDKEHFCMEMNEPNCRNAVPREGIVVRIENDPIKEAFKLKCLKFLGKEAAEMDKGETTDMEMAERY